MMVAEDVTTMEEVQAEDSEEKEVQVPVQVVSVQEQNVVLLQEEIAKKADLDLEPKVVHQKDQPDAQKAENATNVLQAVLLKLQRQEDLEEANKLLLIFL
jgi:hypothetical protein